MTQIEITDRTVLQDVVGKVATLTLDQLVIINRNSAYQYFWAMASTQETRIFTKELMAIVLQAQQNNQIKVV